MPRGILRRPGAGNNTGIFSKAISASESCILGEGAIRMVPGKNLYYDDLETMPPEERQKYCNEKLRWIVKHAYGQAPAVRAKMDEAGVGPEDIRALKDLEKIPITTKDDLAGLQKQNPPFGGFVTVSPNRLRSICMSPGPIYN